jgi:hypothetical protein
MKNWLWIFCLLTIPAFAATPFLTTTTDWEAITNSRYQIYDIHFGRDKAMAKPGMELYWLDAFPCTGDLEKAHTWVSSTNGEFAWDKDAVMRVGCVFRPSEIKLAYRKAKKGASERRADGYLSCMPEPTANNNSNILSIKISNCTPNPFK